MTLDYQCVTEVAVASSRLQEFVPPDDCEIPWAGHVAWPTTETYDMAGKHWLNRISLLSGGAVRRTWPTHGLGKWEVPAGDKFSRERGRRKR